MRPIEFRAWDRQQKKMFSVRGLRMAFGIIEVADAFVSPEWYHVGDNQGDIEIMQFTGLLDSKGQKVYEGDVYKQDWMGTVIIGEIVYGPMARFWVQPFQGYKIGEIKITGEVVGNVWANPDLLKTGKIVRD